MKKLQLFIDNGQEFLTNAGIFLICFLLVKLNVYLFFHNFFSWGQVMSFLVICEVIYFFASYEVEFIDDEDDV